MVHRHISTKDEAGQVIKEKVMFLAVLIYHISKNDILLNNCILVVGLTIFLLFVYDKMQIRFSLLNISLLQSYSYIDFDHDFA